MRYVGGYEGMMRLAATMITFAFSDLQNEKQFHRGTAEYFFTSGNYKLYSQMAGADPDSVFRKYKELSNG